VTIHGYNFGSSQGTSEVLLNNGTVSTVEHWTSREIMFRVTEGMTSGNVIVAVGENESNPVALMVGAPSTGARLWFLYQ
jgi:hypothetical protein